MQEVVWQKNNQIEIQFWDEVTTEDFKQALHQLESLAAENPKIDVLIDAVGVDKFDTGVMIEQFEFYKKYKKHLDRVAIVSESAKERFLVDQINKFSDVHIKTFRDDGMDVARKWIFPSRLPG